MGSVLGHLIIVVQRGLELTGTERIVDSAVDNYWAIKRHTETQKEQITLNEASSEYSKKKSL